MNAYKIIVCSLIALQLTTFCTPKEEMKPNVVIIYADDMGYGDLACQNPGSKILTPFLDKMAAEGIRFSDAHSSSGICTPSRFALLTGSYHWRRTHGIVQSFGKPVFKDTDITLAHVLKNNGYVTACIGKWHLGWDWNFINEKPSGERTYWGENHKVFLPRDIDWSLPLKGGPLDRGFDYYFGDGTINFPPYAWVENDKFVEEPTSFFEFNTFAREAKEWDWDSRPGPMVKGWDPYKVLPTLTNKAISWIGEQETGKSFFLYFALPSPHMPIIPNDNFDGKSGAGAYGDYMCQTDWVVGQISQALEDNGHGKNTIVIFTSDNGPESIAWNRAEKYGHFSMGQFRGLKRDVWEGGHHVPFIIKWPGQIKKGSVSNEVISQVDIMATVAHIVGAKLPKNAAPDSYNFSPILKGEAYNSPLREATIHNTSPDVWGIRKSDWLYINNHTGSGIRQMPESFKKMKGYNDFETPSLLFNMKEDEEQRKNLFNKYPEKVRELSKLLEEYRNSESTVR